MLIKIWIPERLYHALPYLCLVTASVIWVIPTTLTAALCSGFLYLYSFQILFRRFAWRGF